MQIIANQLELTGGIRRDRAECLVDAELYMPPPAIQRKGTLYIITEIEGTPPEQIDPGGRIRTNENALCAETQMTVLKEYYNFNPNATITSALRHALEVANQQVFNRNSAMLPPDRRGVGVTCAVVRGQEVYLAQLPPTQAFLTHQNQLKILPPSPETVRGPRPLTPVPPASQSTLPLPATTTPRRAEQGTGLGRYGNIEPSLTRHVFTEGDLLVLCSSNLARLLTGTQAEEIILRQDSRSVLYQLSDLARSAHITDGYVLAVGAKSEFGANPVPDANTRQAAPVRPDDGKLRGSVEGVAASVSLLTSKFSARNRPRSNGQHTEEYVYVDDPRHAPAPEIAPFQPEAAPEVAPVAQNTRVATPKGTEHNGLEPLLVDDRNNDPWLRREEDNLQHPPYLRNRMPPAEVREEAAGPRPPRNFTYSDEDAAPVPEPAPRPGGRPYAPPVPSIDEGPEEYDMPPSEPQRRRWFGGRNGNSHAGRIEAPPVESPYVDLVGVDGYGPPLDPAQRRRMRRSPNPFGNKRLLLLGLLVIGLVVAVLFLISALGGLKIGNNSKALELVRSAETKRGQAQALAATNPAQARTLIESARTDLEAASKEKADLADIRSVQNGLKITLDNINRVVVPPDLRLAVDLAGQGTGVKITQGVLSSDGNTLYLLDSGQNTVYAADFLGGIKPILKTGDPAGGATFGKPIAIAARLDSIVVVDDQNISYVYNKAKGDWTAAKLGGSQNWTRPVRQIATYQGNLYVFGPVGSQILKYNAGGYVGNPDEWLNPVVGDSLKLDQLGAVAIDGTIYTISKEGRLLQLARPNGKPKGEIQADFDLNLGDKVGPAVKDPRSLQVGTLEYPYMFVVDGEKRVMQFQKEGGGFIQQFQAAPTGKEFDNLRDVAVDVNNKKLYLIGEQKVYVFTLKSETPGPVINATVSGPTGSPLPATTAAPKPSPTFKP